MNFSKLIKISRPRFWLYILGPMLIYFASSGYFEDIQTSFSRGGTDGIFNIIILIIILGYFTLPANLWIYGWNDIADGDTDKFNSKKGDYENKIEDSTITKNKLKGKIWLWNVSYLVILTIILFSGMIIGSMSSEYGTEGFLIIKKDILYLLYLLLIYILFTLGFILPFLGTSYLYSCKPLRAKSKPFIDGIMNVLYIITPFTLRYFLKPIPVNQDFYHNILQLFLSALFRCMAMHCYSAIPDIEPDRKAGLTTTAVYLGKNKSLIYCGILYLLSALLSFSTLGWFSIVGGILYSTMIIISYFNKDIFELYKLFPYINGIIGFGLFRYIILYL